MIVLNQYKTSFVYTVVISVLLLTGLINVSVAKETNPITLQPANSSLSELIYRQLQNHPRYIAAQAQLKAVQSEYEAASKAIYNPELEIDSEKTSVQTSTIGISQTIDWGDQQGVKTLIARYNIEAAQADFRQQSQQLMADLLLTAGTYKAMQHQATLSKQRLALMKSFYQVAADKYNTGDISQVEMDLAQLAYNEAIIDNANIESEFNQAQQNVYALFGSIPAELEQQDFLQINYQQLKVPYQDNAFLQQLPDMIRLTADVAAAKQTVELRRSEASADPTVALRGGKEGNENLVGLTLTIPLNIRNSYSAEIDAAAQQYTRTQQLAQQGMRNIRRDIISRSQHYALTLNAWQQWKKSGRKSIKRQLSLLKRLWRSGDMSTTDYLVQIKQTLDTQSAGIELQVTMLKSWLDLLMATSQVENWLQIKEIRN